MKHPVKHLSTSHLGRLVLLTLPLLLALAPPANATKINLYPTAYIYDPAPSCTCLVAANADVVRFVNQTVEVVSSAVQSGPTGVTGELHVAPRVLWGWARSASTTSSALTSRHSTLPRYQDSYPSTLRTTSSRRLAVHTERSR